MYILKNAMRNVWRAKGRNILMGIIIFIIAIAVCIGFSIRQASEDAKESTLSGMSVTATISVDRTTLMQQSGGSSGSFDKSAFMSLQQQGLELSELETYAGADSVSDFYYSASVYVNGSEAFEAVTSEDTSTDTTGMGSNGGKGGGMSSQGDFTLVGYSSDRAMTDFVSGTSVITDGSVFAENTKTMTCIISDELALFNNLKVGDKIIVANPSNVEETYTLKIKGIYNNSQSDTENTNSFRRGNQTATDPANQIYMSYETLKRITDASAKTVEATTENTEETASALAMKVSGVYVFDTVNDYEQFEAQVRELGLADTYKVSSSDVSAYEESLVPLETLSSMVKYFLIVILIIGAVILVVLNLFNTRARKYEIGVLTAIGMKKGKVAMQFVSEILMVTVVAVLLGGIVGAVTSVPVANSLLESQVAAEESAVSQQSDSFGRDSGFGKGSQTVSTDVTYVAEITSTVDVTILAEVLGISVLLAVLAGGVSVMSIMRYDPLKILSGRD